MGLVCLLMAARSVSILSKKRSGVMSSVRWKSCSIPTNEDAWLCPHTDEGRTRHRKSASKALLTQASLLEIFFLRGSVFG